MSSFSDTQKSILLYFFTTTDTRVACATDNMPSSLWAYLIGSYSRSHEPIRERLLNTLFKDTGLSEDEFAQAITSAGTGVLSSSLAMAERFLRKWAVDYGHNSLKDSAIDKFAVEGCSIYAAKAFEDTELAAFQEKSTRYLSFGVHSVDELALPPYFCDDTGKTLPAISSAFRSVFEAYTAVLDFWEETHFNESDPASFVNEAARRRTARAKAFDKARYYLPTCVKTSFGATMQSRETSSLLSRLLAHPSDEVRSIAEEVLAEVKKVNPGLFSRVEPSVAFDGYGLSYFVQEHPGFSLDELPATYDIGDFTIETRKCSSVGATVQVTVPNSLKRQLASAYSAFSNRRSNTPASFRPICNLSVSSAIGLINMSLDTNALVSSLSVAEEHYKSARTNRHSPVPRYLDHVQLTLDVIMDYGAFRDLQRHRDGKQDVACFLDSKGVIEFPGFDDMPAALRAQCRDAVTGLGNVFLASPGAHLDPYTRLLGHPVAWTYTCSLRQLVYMTELRSQPSGHISYRVIAQQVAEIIESYIPWLFPYVDRTSDTSRASAENAIQVKLASIT